MTRNAAVKPGKRRFAGPHLPARSAVFSAKPEDRSSDTITIQNRTKNALPKVPFEEIARAVLGARYELSLVFVGDTLSCTLNRQYRHKDKPTNILSFPLSAHEGEMFLNLEQVKREVSLFERPFQNLVAFLFIHGLFHLKGYDHGATMEERERQVRRKFRI